MKKTGKILLGVAEFGIDSMQSTAKLYSKNKNIPEEQRDRYSEMADSLGSIKNTIHNYKESIGQDSIEVDDYDDYEYNIEMQEQDLDEVDIKFKKCYNDVEKANCQKKSSLLSDNICDDKQLMEWDKRWVSIGKLSNVKYECNSLSGVGLVRLIFEGKIVYLSRAIELKNGGLSKKIAELQTLKISKKSKAYSKIRDNIDNIYIECICVGNDLGAVEICRKLERELLLKYTPTWL